MNMYRDWFMASRAWSISITAISVIVGAALTATGGSFSWSFYFLTLLAGILMHAATNLINDRFDIKGGGDFRGGGNPIIPRPSAS